MDRTKFFNKITVRGIEELDFLHHNLSKFKMKYTPVYYRIDIHDINRPDLISYKNYGTIQYWWIICLINGIFNPFEDIKVGDIIKIPNKLDIYDFHKKYRMR